MKKLSRRQFTSLMVGGVAAVPVASLLTANHVGAAELPMVDIESATAKALKYVLQTEKEGVNCGSCSLYAGDGSGEKGGCTIFPGNMVPAEAWCSAYQPAS